MELMFCYFFFPSRMFGILFFSFKKFFFHCTAWGTQLHIHVYIIFSPIVVLWSKYLDTVLSTCFATCFPCVFFLFRYYYLLFLLNIFLYHFFFFLWPHLWHMEVPRLGVNLELPAYTTATAMPEPSCICDLYYSLWQRWILYPLSKARDQMHILTDTTSGS